MELELIGETYLLTIIGGELQIESILAFYKLPFDGGQVFKDINRLEQEVKSLINQEYKTYKIN